jgi:hypothetical protein
MSSTTKTPEHVAPTCKLPKGRAVDGVKVAAVAQETAEAEAPHAAQAAQAPEGRPPAAAESARADFSPRTNLVRPIGYTTRPAAAISMTP